MVNKFPCVFHHPMNFLFLGLHTLTRLVFYLLILTFLAVCLTLGFYAHVCNFDLNRMKTGSNLPLGKSTVSASETYRFYHIKTVSQV